jgi:SAM-dependent methyltransferase
VQPSGGASAPCGFCGSTASEQVLRFADFRLQRCLDCAVASVSPVPSLDIAARRYDSTYLGYLLGNDAASSRIFAGAMSLVRRHVPTGRVLDVGFGAGHFLAELTRAGYQPSGVEISAAATEHVRANQPAVGVTGGDFASLDFDGLFQGITLWDSLQYSPTPAAYLRRAHELLAPGGALIVQVPNRGQFSLRYAKRLHRIHPELARTYLHLPAAVTLYGEDSLRNALLSAGFASVHLDDDPTLRRFRWSGGWGAKDIVRNVVENMGIALEKRHGERHPLTVVAIK